MTGARFCGVDIASTLLGAGLSAKNVKGKGSDKTKGKTKGRGQECPRHTSQSRSICGNGEVHRDASLRFHRLAVLDVGLEVPLFHRLASRGSQDARTAQNL